MTQPPSGNVPDPNATQQDLPATPPPYTYTPGVPGAPNVFQRGWGWAQGSTRNTVIVAIAGGTLGLCVLCSCFSIAASAGSKSPSATNGNNHSQSIVSRPTQPPQATKATAQATHTPSATATPILTPEQQLQALVMKDDPTDAKYMKVAYEAKTGSVIVMVDAGSFNNHWTGIEAKLAIYYIERDAWTKWSIKPQYVEVDAYTPVQDRYGNPQRYLFARATLGVENAQKINWTNINNSTDAWNAWDTAWLDPAYQ